jgi:hypothetical protein
MRLGNKVIKNATTVFKLGIFNNTSFTRANFISYFICYLSTLCEGGLGRLDLLHGGALLLLVPLHITVLRRQTKGEFAYDRMGQFVAWQRGSAELGDVIELPICWSFSISQFNDVKRRVTLYCKWFS